MDRTLSWTIDRLQEGWTLEQFLRTQGCSHHVLTHLKRTECGILLNGTWAYTSQKLSADDHVEIRIVEPASSEQILPVPLPISIVYEDEDLMVIDKPSNMPIHPSMDNHDNTLANAVMHYFSSQGKSFVYRCINRLDRDTSGLLILAKNMYSAAILSQMSARREIHRTYQTIVEGILPESGTIDAPIARKEASAIMRCVNFELGEHAVTHFRRDAVFEIYENPTTEYGKKIADGCADAPAKVCSLATVQLETGRTHQIRVHMQHIGHPMIGDFLYNPDSQKYLARQALHSYSLDFTHPVTKKPMRFVSQLPDDMHVISAKSSDDYKDMTLEQMLPES